MFYHQLNTGLLRQHGLRNDDKVAFQIIDTRTMRVSRADYHVCATSSPSGGCFMFADRLIRGLSLPVRLPKCWVGSNYRIHPDNPGNDIAFNLLGITDVDWFYRSILGHAPEHSGIWPYADYDADSLQRSMRLSDPIPLNMTIPENLPETTDLVLELFGLQIKHNQQAMSELSMRESHNASVVPSELLSPGGEW